MPTGVSHAKSFGLIQQIREAGDRTSFCDAGPQRGLVRQVDEVGSARRVLGMGVALRAEGIPGDLSADGRAVVPREGVVAFSGEGV